MLWMAIVSMLSTMAALALYADGHRQDPHHVRAASASSSSEARHNDVATTR